MGRPYSRGEKTLNLFAIFSHSLIEVKGCPKKGDIMDNKTAMIIIVASTVLMQTAIAIGYFKAYVLNK